MKRSILLTMTVLLMMSRMSYGVGGTDTVKGFISDENGNVLNGVSVHAFSGSGQDLTGYTTALSKGYWLVVPSGVPIHIVPQTRSDYDFTPKEYYYPAVDGNIVNQDFEGHSIYNPLGPTIVSPAKNAITSSNPTFIWNKLNVPKYYSVIISTLATLKDTVYIKDSIPKTDTTFTVPTALKSSTTYYFKILSITYPSTGKKIGSSVISSFKTDVNSNIISTDKEKSILFNINYNSKDMNIKYYDFRGKVISKSINNLKNSGYCSIKISASNPAKRIYIGF